MMWRMVGGPSLKRTVGVALYRMLTVGCVAVVLAVSACGSTVQGVSGSELGTDAGAGLGLPQAGADGVAAPNGLTPGSAGLTPGSTARTPGSIGGVTGGTTGPRAAGGTASPAGSALSGRGVTATTVTIGVPVPTGMDGVADSFGISGAGTVSAEDIVNATVRDVNKSGGVLGRKLAVYFHEFDFAAFISNPSQTIAEICADFRDDHKVFAVAFFIADPGLRKCLAKMGSPLLIVGGFSAIMPASAYAEHGGSFVYGPTAITVERLARLFIQSLQARSFTSPWNIVAGGPGNDPVKLGVIHVDTPEQNALYAAYARELAKHGLKFAETVTYDRDVPAAMAATQSAVLRFRSRGITHVFGASAFFLRAAESQNYRPRYAYLPGLGMIGVDNSPPAQLKGALTVGWTPASDVNGPQDPGDTPGAARCRAVMKAGGLSTANRVDLALMYAVCDDVFVLRDALKAGREPSVPGLRRGYEALGTRFGTALTFAASLGPNRHYGVDSVRDMAFDSACKCLKYTSRSNRK